MTNANQIYTVTFNAWKFPTFEKSKNSIEFDYQDFDSKEFNMTIKSAIQLAWSFVDLTNDKDCYGYILFNDNEHEWHIDFFENNQERPDAIETKEFYGMKAVRFE